jgi:hypothetical protein
MEKTPSRQMYIAEFMGTAILLFLGLSFGILCLEKEVQQRRRSFVPSCRKTRFGERESCNPFPENYCTSHPLN